MRVRATAVLAAVLVLGVGACTTGSRAEEPDSPSPGEDGDAAGSRWRAASVAALADLRVVGYPYPGFVEPAVAQLGSTSRALVALAAAGVDPRVDPAAVVQEFRDPDGEGWSDLGASPVAATWWALRAGGAPDRLPTDPDAIVRGLRDQLRPGAGFAAAADGPADPAATVLGLRSLDLLESAAPDAVRAVRGEVAGPDWCTRPRATDDEPIMAAALEVEADRRAGRSCPDIDPAAAPAAVQTAVQAAVDRIAATGAFGPEDIALADAATVLIGADDPTVGALIDALVAGLATTGADPARARQLDPTAAATIADLAATTGSRPVLPAPLTDELLRTVRWRGALPPSPDGGAVRVALGVHALTLLGDGAATPSAWAQAITWDAPELTPADRITLALALAPDQLDAADVAALAAEPGPLDLPAAATLALGAAAAPGGCLPQVPAALDAAVDALPAADDDRLPLTAMWWLAQLADGAQRCGDASRWGPDGPITARLAAALDRRVREGGLYAAAPGLPADPLSTLQAHEVACLLGDPRPADPAALARLAEDARLPNGGAPAQDGELLSIAGTYAVARLPHVATQPCTGAWWQGPPG